ncbi:hypothetical protein [Nonomuraea sp. LPB2021202275-12-8]|uniref:hypothetical protein n=1 Tax=Nonomuraea sp. LPB2021202275-12-8 TaxID=3120159 RepID=UPI00300CF8EF
MITVQGYRYDVTRYRQLGWLLALLGAAVAFRALPWASCMIPVAAVVLAPAAIIAARVGRGQEPPFLAMTAALAWYVLACLWLGPITILLLLAGGLAFAWPTLSAPGWREPVPFPAPISYPLAFGAAVLLQPPRPGVRRDRWWWRCTGCLASAVAATAEEDLRPAANEHAEGCGAAPYPDLPLGHSAQRVTPTLEKE